MHQVISPSIRILSKIVNTRESHCFVVDLIFNLIEGLSLKGKNSSKKDIEKDANTPNIRLLMQLPLQGLWSHIVSRTCYLFIVGVNADGSPKIDNLDMIVAFSMVIIQKYDIIQFDVSMHDPSLM